MEHAPLRVAVLSTPRAGNSWVRHVLSIVFQLQDVAVHDPAELPPLPERVVVQLHWDRTPELAGFLDRHAFRVVTVARHPLDVLVSVLHFARHDPSVHRWLGADLVAGIDGESPTGAAFARFATGEGAGRLLGITPQWWNAPGGLRLRYEELVAEPTPAFEQLCAAIGEPSLYSVEEAVAARPLSFFRDLPNRHGWRGEPGLWRRLITADLATAIRDAHPEAFETLGYACDPDPDLSAAEADATWVELVVP